MNRGRYLNVVLAMAVAFGGNAGKRTPKATDAQIPVTYAATARTPRGANEPVLPKGTQLCSAERIRANGYQSLSKNMVPPKLLRHERPDFTKLPRKERTVRGILFAEVLIDAHGQVRGIHIARSVAPGFDQLVIGELRSSVYEPARMNGHPIPVCMVYTARPHYR